MGRQTVSGSLHPGSEVLSLHCPWQLLFWLCYRLASRYHAPGLLSLLCRALAHSGLARGSSSIQFAIRQGHEGRQTKRREVVRARHAGVIASRSELLSLHCPRHLLFLALLPACDNSQVIMRQDCSAYAAEPLRTAGLLEAAHQYSLQDMRVSAHIPSPLNSLLRRGSWKTCRDGYTSVPS